MYSLTISDRPAVILKAFQQSGNEPANGRTKTVPLYLRTGSTNIENEMGITMGSRETHMQKGCYVSAQRQALVSLFQ